MRRGREPRIIAEPTEADLLEAIASEGPIKEIGNFGDKPALDWVVGEPCPYLKYSPSRPADSSAL